MNVLSIYLFLGIMAMVLCSHIRDSAFSEDVLNHLFLNQSSPERYSNQNVAESITENTTKLSNDFVSNRIFGGDETTIEMIPWQVSLRYNSGHKCGGAIIAASWVITAAHCTPFSSPRGYTVRVGSKNRDRGGLILRIQQFYRHWNYRERTLDYDYSLVKLSQPLNFTNMIQPIQLPNANARISERTMCTVTGFGDTQNTDESAEILRMINIPIANQNYCKRQYDITDRMICAGLLEGGKDSCFGDSGGPLACDVRGSKLLVGVVSYGLGDECGKANNFGIYSKISTVRNWIEQTSGV